MAFKKIAGLIKNIGSKATNAFKDAPKKMGDGLKNSWRNSNIPKAITAGASIGSTAIGTMAHTVGNLDNFSNALSNGADFLPTLVDAVGGSLGAGAIAGGATAYAASKLAPKVGKIVRNFSDDVAKVSSKGFKEIEGTSLARDISDKTKYVFSKEGRDALKSKASNGINDFRTGIRNKIEGLREQGHNLRSDDAKEAVTLSRQRNNLVEAKRAQNRSNASNTSTSSTGKPDARTTTAEQARENLQEAVDAKNRTTTEQARTNSTKSNQTGDGTTTETPPGTPKTGFFKGARDKVKNFYDNHKTGILGTAGVLGGGGIVAGAVATLGAPVTLGATLGLGTATGIGYGIKKGLGYVKNKGGFKNIFRRGASDVAENVAKKRVLGADEGVEKIRKLFGRADGDSDPSLFVHYDGIDKNIAHIRKHYSDIDIATEEFNTVTGGSGVIDAKNKEAVAAAEKVRIAKEKLEKEQKKMGSNQRKILEKKHKEGRYDNYEATIGKDKDGKNIVTGVTLKKPGTNSEDLWDKAKSAMPAMIGVGLLAGLASRAGEQSNTELYGQAY